ncbi:hypothetical protein [Yersinia massiliensis]|uniref:hypothetical protein n=1 Tax=Yersinia massiliensis TaxID=419257 RepID=UPI001CFCCDF7|nr:hypothetical protein [Yersinia massiliensis]MCB5308337.1 hypothetical protein [Yersinia massiliensis]
MATTTKKSPAPISKRDAAFARMMAAGGDSPGVFYARSRGRDYRGFNDDHAAERLTKSDAVINAISGYRQQIIARDVVTRQEVLIDLSKRYRAPTAPELYALMQKVMAEKGTKKEKADKLAALDFSGVMKIKEGKFGIEISGYDMGLLAHRIMTLAGIDVSKPITDEGKRTARKLLSEIFEDHSGETNDKSNDAGVSATP